MVKNKKLYRKVTEETFFNAKSHWETKFSKNGRNLRLYGVHYSTPSTVYLLDGNTIIGYYKDNENNPYEKSENTYFFSKNQFNDIYDNNVVE